MTIIIKTNGPLPNDPLNSFCLCPYSNDFSNLFKLPVFAALQVDLNRHTFEGVGITENAGNGLEVLYSDLHNSLSYIRNSVFSDNKGAGIHFKQFGLTIEG